MESYITVVLSVLMSVKRSVSY